MYWCLQSALVFCVLLSLSDAQSEAQQNCKLDLVIALDGSGSINALEWSQMVNFVDLIINRFMSGSTGIGGAARPLETHISLVKFGSIGVTHIGLSNNFTAVKEALAEASRLKLNTDPTNTSAALHDTDTLFDGLGNANGGDRPDTPNGLILLTDGVPTNFLDGTRAMVPVGTPSTDPNMMDLQAEVLALAQTLKDKNTTVIAVGIGSQVDDALLTGVASTPREYINTTDFDTLTLELDLIINTTCSAIPTTPAPSTTTTTTTTTAPPLPCRANADIYFIIDASGSIGEENYRNITEFVAGLIRKLPVGSGTKVANAHFSNSEETDMNLDTCDTSACAADKVMATTFMRNRTNIADVVSMVRTQGFTIANGDRPGVPNIIVIFTDGNGNINELQTIPEALLAKKAGIHIIVVGITDWVDVYTLQAMASDPYSVNYIQIGKASELNVGTSYRDTLKALLCNDLNECSPDPCSCNSGSQCVDKVGAYTCVCTGDCTGQNCEQSCVTDVDVVFALDASSNLQKHDHRTELDFVNEVIRGAGSRARFGFITYATNATVLFGTSEYDNLDATLNGLTVPFSGGRTNTHLAISEARGVLANANNDKVMVLITDGRSPSYEVTLAEAKAAHDEGIDIVVVGIENMVSLKELQAIASGMDSTNLFTVSTVNDLSNILQKTRDAICNNVGECENVICQNGATPLDRRGYCVCQCPVTSPSSPGYSGQFCERAGSGSKDIVFLIDSSGSMRRGRFRAILTFLSELVTAYPTSQARFGAIYYSDTATMAFGLNKHSSTEDVLADLNNIPYMAGKSNTFAAFDMIRTENIFSEQNGGRASAPNIIYLVTDGQSTMEVDKTIPSAIWTRANEGEIVVLVVGEETPSFEASAIASEPHSDMLMSAPSFNKIISDATARQTLLDQLIMAPNNAIDYCDTSPCGAGATCVNGLHRYICVCPIRRAGLNCDQDCNAQLDLALVLDLTGTRSSAHDVIAFAKGVVNGLSVPTDVRVSVVSLADGGFMIDSHLNTYTSSKMEVLNSLSFRKHGGAIVLADALNILGDEVFTGVNGDRAGIPNAVVLFGELIPNEQFPVAEAAATALKDAGVNIFTVGYGGFEPEDLKALASSPDTTYTAFVNAENSLSQAVQQVVNNLCQMS